LTIAVAVAACAAAPPHSTNMEASAQSSFMLSSPHLMFGVLVLTVDQLLRFVT
jgi:hypothetical protein